MSNKTSKPHPAVELTPGFARGEWMVFASLPGSTTKLDDYAGTVKMERRGHWIALDKDGTRTGSGRSADDAALYLPRARAAVIHFAQATRAAEAAEATAAAAGGDGWKALGAGIRAFDDAWKEVRP